MTSTERPLLLGHRGARLPQLPENTFAAFDLALRAECDGFEFDVRGTGDGKLVVVHDARLRGLSVARSNYAELQQCWQEGIVPRLPLMQRHSLSQEQLALANLPDVLQRYGARAFLDIELKVEGLEEVVLQALRQRRPRRFVVSSFLPSVLRSLEEKDAQLPLGLICESARQLAQWPKLPVSYVIPHHKLASKKLLADLRQAGKKVIVWTVNQETDAREFAAQGVDGIVSDDPEMLARACA